MTDTEEKADGGREGRRRVQRTTAGLVDALFDTVDKLNAKEIDAEHARAISHTARSIVGVARLELEYRQFVQNGGPALTSLRIDKTPPAIEGTK